MIAVLMLFLLPIGGGIPAGVLLARSRGLAWPVTAGLYLVSDLILAVLLEGLIRLGLGYARRVPALVRFGTALQVAFARSVALYGGTGAGPITLILIAFGVDPMTGRASALAAGHGFVTGWALAITGDMLYYAVVALATLRLNAYFSHPGQTVAVMLAAMILVPVLIRALRNRFLRRRSAVAGAAQDPAGQ